MDVHSVHNASCLYVHVWAQERGKEVNYACRCRVAQSTAKHLFSDFQTENTTHEFDMAKNHCRRDLQTEGWTRQRWSLQWTHQINTLQKIVYRESPTTTTCYSFEYAVRKMQWATHSHNPMPRNRSPTSTLRAQLLSLTLGMGTIVAETCKLNSEACNEHIKSTHFKKKSKWVPWIAD